MRRPTVAGRPTSATAARLVEGPVGSASLIALGKVEDLTAKEGFAPARDLTKSASVRALLHGLAEYSPYLWALTQEDPARAARLLTAAPEATLEALLAMLARAEFANEAETMGALRRAKREAALLIAICEIGGVWDIVASTAALSRFADAAVSAGLRFLLRRAAREQRLALDPADPEIEAHSGLVVLALGKHGASELNYSSDIDLIVFYDPQSRAIPEGAAPGPIYVRLTQALARLMQERSGQGYVLRVDLRLRPDPGATPVAMSIVSAAAYYERLGQNWERAALIKARPIAGDLTLGKVFLDELAPFIWRKYFDYASIADVHAMKRQIHAVRGHEVVTVPGHDVKLGRGGIREVEFFVQTQQLIFGGRRPRLRGSRTLDMLSELRAEGWVTREAEDELTEAYSFLRRVEHRLQMIADEQTQRLPIETEALERFARFFGSETLETFSEALTERLKRVEKHYARLFEEAPTLGDSGGSLVFTGVVDDPDTLETLGRLGFQRPKEATEMIRGWHFGRRQAVQSPRAREVLTELVPALLQAFSGSGDPDAALAAFDSALGRMPAAIELLSILRSNTAVRELFGDLLGGAPRLAEVVAARPHVLDAAIDPGRIGAIGAILDETAGAARVQADLARADNYEAMLDRTRGFASEEKFLIGVRLLSGALDPDMAGRAYSALAQGIVEALLAQVGKVFAADHGVIHGARVCLLAMGKFGSREMTAASDLDLILIYDAPDDAGESDGRRPLPPAVYYARLTQRLVAALTAPTKAGRLYEVDLRLRPSGRKGPLATQFSAFRRYQTESAESWEHMALTRARAVAGNAGLAEEIAAATHEILAAPREATKLRKAVRDMRALVAREKPAVDAWDLKLVPGGLLDVEFIAQYLMLANAHSRPDILNVSTRAALLRAGEIGLLDADSAATLVEAHRLFTGVTQMLRLTVPGDFDPTQTAAGVKRRIAAATHLPDFEALAAELKEARGRVREIYGRMFGR